MPLIEVEEVEEIMIHDMQTDLDDARSGWESAVEVVHDQDAAIARKDALLREALDAIVNLAPGIKNEPGGPCLCIACQIKRELNL